MATYVSPRCSRALRLHLLRLFVGRCRLNADKLTKTPAMPHRVERVMRSSQPWVMGFCWQQAVHGSEQVVKRGCHEAVL